MHIVIIEDERLVADDLASTLRELIGPTLSVTQFHSVKEGIERLATAFPIDLIFSDIQLGDGLSFEIFGAVPLSVPIIFCTAYDHYALEAMKANGIEYILKPFSIATLQAALDKFQRFKLLFIRQQSISYEALIELVARKAEAQTGSILIHAKEKIIPIRLEDIALFYLDTDVTKLITYAGKYHYPNKKLDELELLAGDKFYRTNRQSLVSRKAIIDVSNYSSRKLVINLNVPFKEPIVVSKAKASSFLEWLAVEK